MSSTVEVQDENTSVSSAHSYLEPASVEESLKIAVVYGVSDGGPSRMSVSGGPSTFQRCEAGVPSTLPAASIARTSKR